MPVTNNLKIKKLHNELQQLRALGVERTLREHLAIEYKEYSSNPALGLEKYFHDYGLENPTRMTVSQFLSLDPNHDFVWLFFEMVLAMVTEGFRETFNVKELLASSVNTTQTTITLPVIDTTPMKKVVDKDRSVSAGVQFQKDAVLVGDKRVNIEKYGVELDLTYETVENTPFDILSIYLKQRGVALAIDKLNYLTRVMIEGDGGIGRDKKEVVDTIAEIGVQDTSKGVQYIDILTGAVRMALKGFPCKNMIGEETMYTTVSLLPEYYQRYQGTPNTILTLKGGIQTPDSLYPVVSGIGSKCLVIQAPAFCTGEFVKTALRMETDTLITRQLHRIVISTEVGMMNFFRAARLLINGEKTFTNQGFPSFMEITQPK